jgi:hypothetical protein
MEAMDISDDEALDNYFLTAEEKALTSNKTLADMKLYSKQQVCISAIY